ncbi:hypothetical protein C8F04DRAFT_1040144 [Mycena alexandri]|uniref:S-adenosyl-L-methionine-dependent methyltransferase n=1 Tax=Mycena alexandri TaxID=1745969 RepID=A0AAD6X164_9AGAR|nr:hypothetical protein C8F04DRAFT_1040144 [Mycena alexandri]
MKFRAIFETADTMRVALTIGAPTVLRAIMASPSLLFNSAVLSRISMANIWIPFGAGSDEDTRADKTELITSHARGVVLDLGAGHGHTVNYLNRATVTKYVALEPNVLMHPRIREMAAAAGYTEADGTLLVLSCGAEDAASILSSVHTPVDTIVSVLTLCTVPAPQLTIRTLLLDVLAPGGSLLFLEHVRSHRADVAWWQKVFTPMWKRVFDGCCLDRPTDIWAEELVDESGASVWKEWKIWDLAADDKDEETTFWRRLGRFVKK